MLIQESILIWFLTIATLGLAIYCILCDYMGDMTWIATIFGFPWAAYGISQAFYYRKSQKENTKGGITYDIAMAELASLTPAEIIDALEQNDQEI